MLKRLAPCLLLGALGVVVDQWSHLVAIFLICSAANACWHGPPL